MAHLIVFTHWEFIIAHFIYIIAFQLHVVQIFSSGRVETFTKTIKKLANLFSFASIAKIMTEKRHLLYILEYFDFPKWAIMGLIHIFEEQSLYVRSS